LNFQKKPSYTPRDIGILSLICLVAIVLGSVLIGANIALSRVVHGGGGFFVGMEAARAFLFEHTDPYSETVASLTQELAYGRSANKGENPYILTIPFYLLPFYFPFTLFTESASARGLWMFISEAGLAGSAFLALRLIEWQPRRLFIIFFSLISIFNYYSVAALLEGSPVILLGYLYLGFLFAYYSGRDELAGALLVLTLFDWQVGFLFMILVIWKIFSDKRWHVLFGFGMTFIILLTLSFLIYPGWIFSIIIAIFAAIRSKFGITSVAIFARLSPGHGNQITLAVTILIIVILIYEWAAARKADFRHFIWAACLTLAATPLMGFRTEMSNLVVLFPCLALVFEATTDRWKTGYWLTGLLLTIVLLVPWAFFVQWTTLNDQHFYDYLFLFYPVFTIVGLYWIRWWFIRPPRTWLDHMRSAS
jgi:hypothetical protein